LLLHYLSSAAAAAACIAAEAAMPYALLHLPSALLHCLLTFVLTCSSISASLNPSNAASSWMAAAREKRFLTKRLRSLSAGQQQQLHCHKHQFESCIVSIVADSKGLQERLLLASRSAARKLKHHCCP
jgi:hypothetical protein